MRLGSTGTVVIVCAALIVASELSEAMLPLILRRAAARSHLRERLLNEINEIDFSNLSGQPIRRRSTVGGDPGSQRLLHDAAATIGQTLSDPQRARKVNRTTAGKSHNFVPALPDELPKVDLFGDTDWPPRPRRQRNCEVRMMAGLSGMRILGNLAKCLDDGNGVDRQPETKWNLEGPIADYEDFYLKKKPEAQKFTAKFEKMVDELLVKRDGATAADVAHTG